MSDPRDDAALIAAVRGLAAGRVDPATAEEQVGKRALVNTETGMPVAALRRVPLSPDPDFPDEPLAVDAARAVIYWDRPLDGDNPRVVGIQLGPDARPGSSSP
ncbi:hypothetical protein AB0M20_10855 [Actinoplanes sp. NPDC051633]|uniref:hypothetical protein n=1 Tax=Actinoplanes sp. NPDC051633 TaxID=3155670 RepID=UPI003449D60D